MCRPLPPKHPPCDLPDHVIVAMLERDALLSRALQWTLDHQLTMDKKRLKSLQIQQAQVGLSYIFCAANHESSELITPNADEAL